MVVLLVAMASFMTSTAVTELTTRAVHARSLGISRNALPSIEHLEALRSELFRTQLLVEKDLHADPEQRVVLRQELVEARADLRRELAAYRQLPTFPGERVVAQALEAQVQTLDAELDRLPQPPGSEAQEVLQRTGPELEQAEATAFALIGLNTDQGEMLSRSIEQARRRSVWIAWILDGLSAILSLLVAFLAWRTVRYYLDTQEAQQALLGARAEELEAFSGRVAHDILNPLNAVQVALALLERGVEPGTVIPRARNSVRRVHRIIDALLSFARAGARPELGATCELRPVLEGVLHDAEEMAEERNVELKLEALPDDAAVACPPGVLASIAGNLVANAIKYLGEAFERQVAVRAWRKGTQVVVEVQDTGPGIELNLQRTLFEPYVRGNDRSQPGIGLGLATAKKLCEAHGGQIGVRSAPGRGSTFWFQLPAAEGVPARPSEPAPGP